VGSAEEGFSSEGTAETLDLRKIKSLAVGLRSDTRRLREPLWKQKP
jgi:hypothetical protein